MLFKRVRAGDEVILATPDRQGVGNFSFAIAEVQAVKTSAIIVAGYQFNLKDGRGRTVRHQIYPATEDNRRQYLGEKQDQEPIAKLPTGDAEIEAEDKLRKIAFDALKIIREETSVSQNDDIIEILGVETLAAFRRQWRKLNSAGDKK